MDMGGAAGFGGFMQAVDLGMGLWSAERARRYGRQMAVDERQWLERMSNTAVQRHVSDMRRAGINPMSNFSGQASSPGTSPAPTIPDYHPGTINSAAVANMMVSSATARKLNAEAQLVESEIPFSAANARARSDKFSEEVVLLGQQVEKMDIDIEHAKKDLKLQEEMLPLIVEWNRLRNEADRLGLDEARAMSEFYKQVGGYAKWIQMIKEIFPTIGIGIGSIFGRGAKGASRGNPNRAPAGKVRYFDSKTGEIYDRRY